MPTALHVVVRFIWYVISRLLVWVLAAGLVVLSFFVAMDYMNARILVQDSMQLRAQVIIKGEDPTTLSQVFSKGFLENDTKLESDIYQQYNISDFDYKIDPGFKLIFPWQKSVTLSVSEEVRDIEGQIYANTETPLSETPPVWDNAVYNMTLVRYEDNWRIVSMDIIEQLPDQTPAPTETPTATPSPTPNTSPSEVIED